MAMDPKLAKDGLEQLAVVIADLLEDGLDQAANDAGPPSAYAPVAAAFGEIAQDLGTLAAAMAVIARRAAAP